jgi:hypothetical protein
MFISRSRRPLEAAAVLRVRKVILDLKAIPARRVIPVRKVTRAILVIRALRAILVHKAPTVPPDLPEA